MNYNLYFAQMDYIGADGDTLQVKPSQELKLLTINDHLFYYDQKSGYIEIVEQLPVALGAEISCVSYASNMCRDAESTLDLRGAN